MGGLQPEPQPTHRTPPPELAAQAAKNPGGWVLEIDTSSVDDPDGYVPPESIRGAWRVGRDGRLTGEYETNANFGPPQDDFSKLTEPDYWLGWMSDDPSQTLRSSVADLLADQVPGAILEWMKVLESPRFVTVGRRRPGDDQHVVVTRCGLAVSFALAVQSPNQSRSILRGVFTWCAARLDQPDQRCDQVWLDLQTDLDWAQEQLRHRIYSLDVST